MAGKVGQTMSMHTDELGDSQPGCGFIITDDRGKSCIAIAYAHLGRSERGSGEDQGDAYICDLDALSK
jgi:hypothetical protein